MILSQISDQISDSIEDLNVLSKIYENSHAILESDSSATLRKVTLANLPKENVWEFQSEIEHIECLKNQNSTVERTILYQKDDVLYAFMIELKSSLAKKNISKLKSKFSCSLVTLTLYIANHPYFRNMENVSLFSVGVVMFNDNSFQYSFDEKDLHLCSDLQKEVFNFKNSTTNNLQKTSVQIKPPTLNRTQIPVIFLQNPDWISTPLTQSEEFVVDFNTLFENTPKPKK